MSPGSVATFIDNKSQCHFCGSMESVPDGKFIATLDGFIDLFSVSSNPVQDIKNIISDLKNIKNNDSSSKIANKDKIENFLKAHSLKINLTIFILEALLAVLSTMPKNEINNTIIRNEFINNYNNQINIGVK
jgi:hypothetical protein